MDQPGNHILLRGNQPAAADRMRELLARTVQDQFADQRSNAGAIDDVRQRMEGLEWLVKEVREQEIPGMAAQLDGLARQFEETTQRPPSWAESLAEHIEVLRAQVSPVAELHSLWADLGRALEALQVQDDRLTKLHQSVNKVQQSMESAAGRFSRLDKAVAELAQRTGQLDKELSAVKGRAEVGFGALAAKVDQSAETTTRQLTQSMAAMTATVDGLSDNVAGVGGQVDLLGGQVQAVHGRIERLDERLADTDDKLGSVDARLTSADDKLGALDTRLTAADGKIGSTDARVAALDARLERLDERLDDQYDRVSAIDHTLGATDTKLGAIGTTLSATDTRIGVAEAALVAVDTKLGGLDTRMERLDERLGEHGRGLTSVDGKLGTVAGRLGPAEEFCRQPELLPDRYQVRVAREGGERVACDYLAGMTDRYAVRLFEQLYVPKPWTIE